MQNNLLFHPWCGQPFARRLCAALARLTLLSLFLVVAGSSTSATAQQVELGNVVRRVLQVIAAPQGGVQVQVEEAVDEAQDQPPKKELNEEEEAEQQEQFKQLEVHFTQQFRPLLSGHMNLLRQAAQPSDQQAKQIQQRGKAALKTTVMAMVEWQKKMQTGRWNPQTDKQPDPHGIFNQEIIKATREELSPEQFERLNGTIERREASRKRAAILCLVARMDNDLYLSLEQREKMYQALDKNWNPLWHRNSQFYLHDNGSNYPMLPDAPVLEVLNDRQKQVWSKLPRVDLSNWGWGGFLNGMIGNIDADEANEDNRAEEAKARQEKVNAEKANEEAKKKEIIKAKEEAKKKEEAKAKEEAQAKEEAKGREEAKAEASKEGREQPAAEKPAAEKPAAEKPAAEKPAGEVAADEVTQVQIVPNAVAVAIDGNAVELGDEEIVDLDLMMEDPFPCEFLDFIVEEEVEPTLAYLITQWVTERFLAAIANDDQQLVEVMELDETELNRVADDFVAAIQNGEEEDDEGDGMNEQQRAAARAQAAFEVGVENFDVWIYSNQGGRDQAKKRIDDQLKVFTDAMRTMFGLNDDQIKKLELAGRGDVQRFEQQVERARAKFMLVRKDQQKFGEIWTDIGPLQQRMQGTFFNDQSLVSKSLPLILTSDQQQKYDQWQADRRKFHYFAKVELIVAELETYTPMSVEQRDRIVKLITDAGPPPLKRGQYDYIYVMYQMSQVPDDKWRVAASKEQLELINKLRNQGRQYQNFLRQNNVISQ